MATRAEYEAALRREAAKVMGVRFLQNGRVPSQGLDCLGLIVYVQRAAGVAEFPDADKNYNADWHLHASMEPYLDGMMAHGRAIERAEILAGDVVMFRMSLLFPGSGSQRIQHAGVILDATTLQFAHCIGGRGVSLSLLTERAWTKCHVATARANAVLRYLGET